MQNCDAEHVANPNCDMKKFEISFNSRAEPIKKAYFGNKVSVKKPSNSGVNDAESRRRNEQLESRQVLLGDYFVHFIRSYLTLQGVHV